MTRSARILLGDILEAAELLERYTAGISHQQFANNLEKQDAVARRIEVMGKPSRASPSPFASGTPKCRGGRLPERGMS